MDIEQELRLRHIDQQQAATWRCLDHALVQRSRISQAHGLLPVLGALLAGQKAGMQAALAVGLVAAVFCLLVSRFTFATTADLRLLQIHLDQSAIASRRALAPDLRFGFVSEQHDTFRIRPALEGGSDPMVAVVRSSLGLCALDAFLVGSLAVLLMGASAADHPNRWQSPATGVVIAAVMAGLVAALAAGWLSQRSLGEKERAAAADINRAYYTPAD